MFPNAAEPISITRLTALLKPPVPAFASTLPGESYVWVGLEGVCLSEAVGSSCQARQDNTGVWRSPRCNKACVHGIERVPVLICKGSVTLLAGLPPLVSECPCVKSPCH
jgi:hypothetical protein